MASHLKNISNKNLRPDWQANDHMPKRRKRYCNKISLMLLIFVSCCLTLILSPLHVQAKELSNATSKGENMLSNDRQSHQHDEGETNINADKTNDNGTFKRLQLAGIEIENAAPEEEEQEENGDEHSTEVIEMIQPPHTLRHQEHYKQRILLGEKHKQQQHLHGNSNDNNGHDDNEDDDDDDDAVDVAVQERELTQYNRNLRYTQIQEALREPIASTAPHHRRHEHHLAKQRLVKQTELSWPQQQHHLRHQHHQQQTQEFQSHSQPQLRHLKHEMRKQNITATKMKQPLLHSRYFDRESSYMHPMDNMPTTEGPHLRHTGSNLHWKSIAHLNNPHNHLFGDDGNNNQRAEEEDGDIKRFSLSLDGHETERENVKANKGKETLDENTGNHANYDANDSNSNSDSDNDYSYEDDDVDDGNKEINRQNNYPSIASYSKTNVKRYTNPQKPFAHKPSVTSTTFALRHHQNGHHSRHNMPAHNMDVLKINSNNNKDEDEDYDDDIENMQDDIDDSSSTSDESSDADDENNDDDDNDNNGDKLSDEKWNKIEHEHYRKQLQHQRAMQALRSRRPPQNDNTPHTATTAHNSNNNNKYEYASYSPSSLSAISTTHNAAWKKRQTINEDETDNIYARHYVPGSVTRKKEEELGSPAAILESRRQYALQQRQNKALASAHHRRIVTEGTCRWPQPRVERIRRDSWKIYTPHCTILHRCADDAGCCPSERQTCAPKRTKNVDLYFFVISLNETQGSIEKLSFANHTECHCINRSKQRAPEYASSGAKDLMGINNQIPYLRRATILNCYCPNLFEKILQEDGYCRCDCSSGNLGCDWLKRGMEHFSMNDRKCIIEGRCKLPTCEYGQYIKKHGRCPRREERHISADGDW